MITKAKSGHVGFPLGNAASAHALWSIINITPHNPKFINRDRVVLSSGHGSSLLYVMNYLCGYEYTLDDLKSFRQLHSKTPGHPEYNINLGIECTTGPLGAGISICVGFAIAEKHLSSTYNTPEFNLIDNYTYCFAGDGCLMEGVCCEAVSLAGHLKLNKLIVLYDDNKITLDGSTDMTFTENTKLKFESLHWNVLIVDDGNDWREIQKSILLAKQSKDQPTLIMIKNIIGFGLQNQGTH